MDHSRILTLYRIFVTKTSRDKQLSMKEILHILEDEGVTCCEKSLLNDIKQLKEVLHLNIQSTKGRYARYYLESFIFTLDEAKKIVDAVNAYPYMSARDNESIIDKVKELMSEFEEEKLERDFYTVTRFKACNELLVNNLEILNSAIKKDKQVKFDYQIWNKDKKLKTSSADKKISPFSIILSKGKYYLFGYKINSNFEAESRNYRIDKMCNIIEIPLRRIGAEKFEKLDMDNFVARRKSMYDGQVEDIRLNIPVNKIGVFIDQFGAENISVEEESRDRVVINFKAVASKPFLIWVLGISGAKLKKPKNAVDNLNIIIDNYQKLLNDKKI